MNQEQLMKVKIKYLEDRITTMEKSLGRIHKVMAHYQMMENESEFKRHEQLWQNNKEQGFKDVEIYESVGGGFDFDDEPKSKDNDNELI